MRKIGDVLSGIRGGVGTTSEVGHVSRPESNCIPGCPICGGIGYVRLDLPVHDPNFGKIQRCPNAKMLDIERRQSDPRIGLTVDEVRNLTWESIMPSSPVYDFVGTIREAVKNRSGFILLVGPPGRGKTLMLKVTVAVAIHAEYDAAYANMSEILDDLRRSFDANSSGTELASRMDWWMRQDVLAIDEYDKVNSTPWAQERIHLVMDTRYRKALYGEGVTVVAANSEPKDDYLISRFNDARVGKIIRLGGNVDARTRAKPNWPR
jgi:DNA replication protein DnaC